MTDIDGALVLVTGATGGFGAHMVEQFHAAGSRLIVTDSDPSALNTLAAEYGHKDKRIEAVIYADLATSSDCQELFDRVNGTGLVPDILINNAGIALAGRLDHVGAGRAAAVVDAAAAGGSAVAP